MPLFGALWPDKADFSEVDFRQLLWNFWNWFLPEDWAYKSTALYLSGAKCVFPLDSNEFRFPGMLGPKQLKEITPVYFVEKGILPRFSGAQGIQIDKHVKPERFVALFEVRDEFQVFPCV